MASSQIPSHASHGLPEGARCQSSGRRARLSSHDGQQISLHDLTSQAIRFAAREVAQLQQAHRKLREEPHRADQAVCPLHLPRRNPAARFEATSASLTRLIGTRPNRHAPTHLRWPSREAPPIPAAQLLQAGTLPRPEWPKEKEDRCRRLLPESRERLTHTDPPLVAQPKTSQLSGSTARTVCSTSPEVVPVPMGKGPVIFA
jgi:hypothetical protein